MLGRMFFFHFVSSYFFINRNLFKASNVSYGIFFSTSNLSAECIVISITFQSTVVDDSTFVFVLTNKFRAYYFTLNVAKTFVIVDILCDIAQFSYIYIYRRQPIRFFYKHFRF